MCDPVTKDPIITVITTLASMLGHEAAEKERMDSALVAAHEECSRVQGDLEDAKRDRDFAEHRSAELHRDLARATARETDSYKTQGKAHLFEVFITSSSGMLMALGWLRDNRAFVANNKIAAIKRVREEAHLGLKEAKDFVETFLAVTAISDDPNNHDEPSRGDSLVG